ncbi:MAG: bifunctional demethylmenaquinone methyltransferase/2-methoxy-6-polyprenyl-1,4-benzoquinol methylase UbiE [Alphaproteobacteria bacterium]|nr:bifunctional demethylmenaquinone methyltransferase/2-methoxy-6-polyprenyl-1,4-benzoquinol methylase UbiE [Alphaproteobacteria bacterium]
MAEVRPPSPDEEPASFGFNTVPRAEKAKLVKGVFDRVARNYDLMNDLMSAGLHRVWKDAFADFVNPQPGETIYDLAGGTGDIARRLAKRADKARRRRGGLPARIVVSDINEEMLAAGRTRGDDGLEWEQADAENLPFPDASADAVTIAFGIRNVTDIDKVLREARRVLKPGGRFACLEFSRLAVGALEPAYDLYSFQVIPRVGKLVANDEAAYRYLVESIRRFPEQEKFLAMIRGAGFGRAGFRNFTAGVAALHYGWAV